ncbi:MAG: hypothetical protein AAF696_18475 [Bacteroidota bacterium]
MNKTSHIKERQEYDAWMHACKKDTLTAYLRFISNYPKSRFQEEALKRSKELEEERAWKAAKGSDQVYAYEKFLDEYPDGSFAKEAGKRIHQLENSLLKKEVEEIAPPEYGLVEEIALEEATNVDSIAAYNNFLKNFPHSNYGKQIRDRMHQLESQLAVRYRFLEIELQNWELADKMNTALAYRDFLQKFPNGKFANLATARLEELGEKGYSKTVPDKREPERISINPRKSPLFEVIRQHKKEKDLEEKSAISVAYVWLGVFVFNALVVYLLAPVFIHFVMALALLSAGYLMYSRIKELSDRELSVYVYGMCLAIWVSSREIFSFLSVGQITSWIFASLVALIALLLLLRYVDGISFRGE